MGRGKLSLNLISNRKSRISSFKKRKNSLMKKAYELSTLCDVRMCVLIHGPGSAPDEDRSHSDVEFHTWPSNRSEIEGMIRAYKTNLLKRKSSDLYDVLSDRKSKIEKEKFKLRENVEEVMRPKWDKQLDCLSEGELRAFMDGLDSKIEAVSGMIDFMETDYSHLFGEVASTTEFSSEDGPNVVQMGGDLNPPEMPPLDELVFPELFSGSTDRIGFNFEDLQSLFEGDDDNNMEFEQYRNLLNDEFEYGNDLEHLMMAGNF